MHDCMHACMRLFYLYLRYLWIFPKSSISDKCAFVLESDAALSYPSLSSGKCHICKKCPYSTSSSVFFFLLASISSSTAPSFTVLHDKKKRHKSINSSYHHKSPQHAFSWRLSFRFRGGYRSELFGWIRRSIVGWLLHAWAFKQWSFGSVGGKLWMSERTDMDFFFKNHRRRRRRWNKGIWQQRKRWTDTLCFLRSRAHATFH